MQKHEISGMAPPEAADVVKVAWEAPDVRSLEVPAVNGGEVTSMPESYESPGENRGSTS